MGDADLSGTDPRGTAVVVDLRDGPGWLGLGWLGSGVLGGAAVAVTLGGATGVFLSLTSDRSPDDAGSLEVPLALGIAFGIAVVLPAGVLLGLALGLVLRAQARLGGATPARCGLTGLAVGAVGTLSLAVVAGVVRDPSATPGLPHPVVAVPALVAALAASGLALLMQRSAARLLAWPTSTSPPPR